MLSWISENIGTIVICLVLCAIVAGIIIGLAKDGKKGKSSCCGNCATAPWAAPAVSSDPARKETRVKTKTEKAAAPPNRRGCRFLPVPFRRTGFGIPPAFCKRRYRFGRKNRRPGRFRGSPLIDTHNNAVLP